MFQFQIGAIKRPFAFSVLCVLRCGFNSKLVRLKAKRTDRLRKPTATFQFQIGAIKRAVTDVAGYFLDLFQFQIGAIKSLGLKVNSDNGWSFNSKLVRLKVP